MGDYGRASVTGANVDGSRLASNGRQSNVFSLYKDHSSAPRSNTDFILAETIRAIHPDYDVITIDRDDCDLIGYAAAGHATLRMIRDDDQFHLHREYTEPTSRLAEGLGKLCDKPKFALYNITWQGQEWQAYAVEWVENYRGTQRYWYFLSPKTSATPVDSLLLAACKWSSELHDEIYVFDDGDWEKDDKLWQAVQKSAWEDVILDPEMKQLLISDVQNFFDSREVYEEYAVPWKRGIILHGTPGCGKTISIKALMNTLDKRQQPVASLYVKSLKSGCGTQQWNIHQIFSQARVMAPCLLVFEDLDSLVVDEVRSYFLNEVDGLEDNNGILMIGSTNHLDRLDPGISKRPSRFDRKYHYRVPGRRERMLYCEYWKKKLERNNTVDFDPAICDVVAQITDGFSFAYLKELFVQTLLAIVNGRGRPVEEAPEITDTTKKVGEEKTEGVQGAEGTAQSDLVPPKVEIPEHLKSNPLMQILEKQFQSLWKDMDNSKDEEAGVKKEASTEAKEKVDEGDESKTGGDS
ncbi:P-loop containing nucleoside triphosphate hydrolase protein [Neohortaea acidophila]|uniref:P-loop containing nucleoside triphosphate hydrolase protein n=1 Tax=Neohortaea acidophila TaxID=245834 RepID=A0A6A6PKJ4_9PEZI|nr:P-loop containing nucleoside triphosphate hydrolase protein [Neohortaea acidophila]KAF2480013.1 P-loop containing nucleoside triphosphate hydrolase protein [Neohortaea acidophila]